MIVKLQLPIVDMSSEQNVPIGLLEDREQYFYSILAIKKRIECPMNSVIILSHMVHHRCLLILGYCKECKKSVLRDHLPTTLVMPKMDTKNTAHFKIDECRELLPRIVSMFPREAPEGSLITPETQPPNSFPYFFIYYCSP